MRAHFQKSQRKIVSLVSVLHTASLARPLLLGINNTSQQHLSLPPCCSISLTALLLGAPLHSEAFPHPLFFFHYLLPVFGLVCCPSYSDRQMATPGFEQLLIFISDPTFAVSQLVLA